MFVRSLIVLTSSIPKNSSNISFYKYVYCENKFRINFKCQQSNIFTFSINYSSKKIETPLNNFKNNQNVIPEITNKIQTGATIDKAAKVETRIKPSIDFMIPSFERNFITKEKAESDFLLKPSDLEALSTIVRRSPFENGQNITVYWRQQVEARSLEIHGSKEKLREEKIRREMERDEYNLRIFHYKKLRKDIKKAIISSNVKEQEDGLRSQSGKVVIFAVGFNAFNFFIKLGAWITTGSHSMFCECIHSFADTLNQMILAYGVQKSIQAANANHPYGYMNMKYIASLISGVGIFCVGSGLSFYHGFMGFMHPQPIVEIHWAYLVLSLSLVTESLTCAIALKTARRNAENLKMPLWEYIKLGQEPAVNVVLMEDLGAVLGVILAGSCITISAMTQSHIPDAIGSLLVGGVLGYVASFIIYTNVTALLSRSIPQAHLDKLNTALEGDPMIRAIHDVKGIDIGNSLIRYKAELDFDGRALTKVYLDKQNLNNLLQEVRKVDNIDMVEEFMLKYGEAIVDTMGGEIDRIEIKLRTIHPEMRHCDLEIT